MNAGGINSFQTSLIIPWTKVKCIKTENEELLSSLLNNELSCHIQKKQTSESLIKESKLKGHKNRKNGKKL